MSAEWWALELVGDEYELECPRRTCGISFRSHARRRAHLEQDHGFSLEFANQLLERVDP